MSTRLFFTVLIFLTINSSCHTNEKKGANSEHTASHFTPKSANKNQDTICSFHKISKSSTVNLSEEFTDVNYTFLFNKTLYLLGSGAKSILMMDIGTGEIKKSAPLNKLIDSISSKLGFPDLLVVTKGRYYIGFDQGIVCISDDYKIIYQIKTFYNHFLVNQSEQLIVFRDFDHAIYGGTGELIKKVDTDLGVLHFYKSNDGFYCDDDFSLKRFNITADTLMKTEIAQESKFPGFNPSKEYPGFITKDYIFWFDFAKRDKLIVTDKAVKRIIKTIPFKGVNWAMTNEEQQDAAGNPTFFVDIDGDNFYVSVYKSDSLLVYKGCLGLMEKSN